MRLPVLKPRTYLSPSSINSYCNCQYYFYLRYLAGLPYVKDKSSFAQAVGTVFDAHVKHFVAELRGVKGITFEKLLADLELEEPDREKELYLVAETIYNAYVNNGYLRKFSDATDVIIDREMYTQVNSIPLLGIPDFIIDGIPFDLKTKGFNSKASPTKGYIDRMTSGGVPKGDYKEIVALEDANPDWARQMLHYNWYIGETLNTRYWIDEVVNMTNDFHFCTHKGVISSQFQSTELQKTQQIWQDISGLDVEIEDPMPMVWKCEKYNQVCDRAEHCDAYKQTLGDPAERINFV